jgi:nitronate monooxygenase
VLVTFVTATICTFLPRLTRFAPSIRVGTLLACVNHMNFSLLRDLIEIDVPIVQAPMAGVSTPEMAAAVSNAGALGSIGVGATAAAGAREMIAAFRARSKRSLNVNVFCHAPARPDAARQARFIERLRPELERYGAAPPRALREIYKSFVEDDAMLAVLVAERPKVVSFHFGVPSRERIAALQGAGIVLIGTATSVAEARALADAGASAIVAQGWEAGGHRGVFDPRARDDSTGTLALVRLCARAVNLPIIAAGGIMDGAGIAAALRLGASAAQLGTAFVACDESLADAGYRAALASDAAHHTVMTRAISGRPARCLANRFTALDHDDDDVPDYPIAYDLGKALHAAAKARGEFGWGAQWAGQAAPLSRPMPAAALVELLKRELASE